MDNKIRVFIKLHKAKNSNYTYSCITLGENGYSSTLFSAGIFDKNCSRHNIILEAIINYLKSINTSSKKAYTICFYTDDDQIAYEWNNEYLKDKKFSDSTLDTDLYSQIIKLASKTKITIQIIGRDNTLSALGRII